MQTVPTPKRLGGLFLLFFALTAFRLGAETEGRKSLGASFFFQSSPTLAWTTEESRSSAAEIDWTDYARYYAFPSILDFGLDLRAGPARLVFRVDIRPDFLSFATSTYLTNLPFVEHGLDTIGDVNMPTVGYFDYAGERSSLSLGRRQLKWGPGTYGLAISDNAPYLDHLEAEYYFPTRRGRFWYEFVAIGADRFGETWVDAAGAPSGAATGDVGPYKNIFAHRLGWEGDSFRLAVGELNLVHDIVPGLIDISPFAVYHNMYQDAYSNVMLDATIEGRLAGLRAYGEFVMDDLVMPWEDPGARPTALGFLAGAEWNIMEGRAFDFGEMSEGDYLLEDRSFGRRGGLSLRLEFYRTTAYIYNREVDSGRWTIPDHRLVSADPFYVDESNAFCLGFPWGPDTRLELATLGWEGERTRAALSLAFLQKGATTIDSSWDTSDATEDWFPLKEPVVRNLVLGLSGQFSLRKGLGLWAKTEFWFGDTPKADLEAGLSLRFSTK